jgi:parvulin-like peptidyl-prolyl isomerase
MIMIGAAVLSFDSSAKIGDQPIIKVNNRVITVDEFKRLSQIDVFEASLSENQKKEIVDNVIFFELAVQEAKKRGYANLDSVKDELNIALYKSYFNSDIRPQIDRVQPNSKQIEQEYSNYPVVDSSHIFVAVPADASGEQRIQSKQKIDQIHQALIAKTGEAREALFQEMAREFSSDPSKERGGRLGYLGADQALPHYYAIIKNLSEGEVSKPFASVFGWHLALAHRKLPAQDMGPTYAEFLASKLRGEEGLRKIQEAAATLRKNAKVEVNDTLLKNVSATQ